MLMVIVKPVYERVKVMYARKPLIDGLQKHTVRFFLKGPGSSVLLAGTLALAGLSAAALSRPGGGPEQQDYRTVLTTTLPSSYGCFNDPDGDGTIKCDSTVPLSSLPAAWGTCQPDLYGDGLTVCDGTSN
jgi:hypothetical protein